MNKSIKAQLIRKARGATMVEYALILFVMAIVGGAVFKTLGSKVQGATERAGNQLGS